MRTYAYKGEGVEKSVIRYVHSKWTNVVDFFCVHWSGQVLVLSR